MWVLEVSALLVQIAAAETLKSSFLFLGAALGLFNLRGTGNGLASSKPAAF
jgi:hypothetical protein